MKYYRAIEQVIKAAKGHGIDLTLIQAADLVEAANNSYDQKIGQRAVYNRQMWEDPAFQEHAKKGMLVNLYQQAADSGHCLVSLGEFTYRRTSWKQPTVDVPEQLPDWDMIEVSVEGKLREA